MTSKREKSTSKLTQLDSDTDSRLIIVSNRLPIVLEKGTTGLWSIRPGSGGLVTALAPVLRNRGGTWIGWLGDRGKR